MISAPTMLRPSLAAASRTSSLHKPAATAYLLRTATPLMTAAQTPMKPMAPMCCPHARFMSLKRKVANPAAAPSYTLTLRRSAASYPSHRPPSQTGPARNRDAAEDAAAAAAVASSSSSSAAASSSSSPPLDWNTFFQLRKTRRRIQLAFSVVGGLTGGLVGGLFLGSGVAEPVLGQIPLDPFVTLGLMTFGFSALGWLVGPSVGNVVFYAWKRQYKAQMTLKEVQFFARVKKNRVDPSNSSAGNPVPDFYGEKISSVAGYRQWLKDQRAYNKKRTTFV